MNNSLRAKLPWPENLSGCFFLATLAALLVLGIMFRSWGVLTGTLDFWADEAWWAINVIEQPLLAPSIRPVAYMWLSKQLNQLGNPELFLRLPSYLAGVGVVACICASAMLLFRSRLVVLFVVFIAVLNPRLIVYAKEFKPYSLETFIHSGLFLWALVCWQRRRTSAAFWIAAGVALPFCYNVVFLYPALVLALAPQWLDWARLPEIRKYVVCNLDRRLLLALGAVAILAILTMSALFENERKLFWGAKYGVFPVELGVVETLAWYARETWLLVTQPAALRAFDPAVEGYLRPVLFAAYVAGVASLVHRRRYAELGLLVLPLGCVAMANVMGFWPYGDFRTNLFLIPGALLVMGLGLDAMASHAGTRILAWAAMLAFCLSCLPLDIDYFRWKWMRDGAPAPQITEVLNEVVRRRLDDRAERDVIIADWHSWRTLDYYLRYHPEAGNVYSPVRDSVTLVRGPLNGLPLLESLLLEEYRQAVTHNQATRVWVVVTKLDQFSGVHETPLVKQFRVHAIGFSTQDRTYHPEMIELQFEWSPATPTSYVSP